MEKYLFNTDFFIKFYITKYLFNLQYNIRDNNIIKHITAKIYISVLYVILVNEKQFQNFFQLIYIFYFIFFKNITKYYITIIYVIPLKNNVFWYFIVYINGKMNLSLHLFNVNYSLKSIL